ncbi:putative PurR-regulated permease PerM [Naumannella halotolerans]|uniref:Putative PurR-regulated permease PerM n=1 Tax=Naumannella halotolerans TaxID=993414 RepID=A0A4R7J813_9ACTN|nr:putative PurR-regulated permease PerM [Naumannella halotolerans]
MFGWLTRRGAPTRPTPAPPAVTQRPDPSAEQRELRRISGQLDGLTDRIGTPRVLLVLLSVGAGILIIFGIREFNDIIAPVFFGINLVLAAAPLASWLRRRGVPKALAATAAGIAVLIFLFLFFYAIYYAIAAFVQEMPRYAPQFISLYNSALELLGSFGITTLQITQQLQGINPQSVVSAATGVLSNVGSVGSLLLVLLTVIFFLVLDLISIDDRMRISDMVNPRITEALVSFSQGVRRYWVVTTVFGIVVAVLDVVLLMAIGVPLALVWGVLSFITNYIPNIGFVLGLVPPALMALLDSGPVAALIVVIGYSVLNFVIQSLIQPKFTGDAVGVTPTISFLSLLFWASVLGPLGALLALPSTLLVKALLIDADPKMRWLNAFIASDPSTAKAGNITESFHGDDVPPDAEPGRG